MSFDVLLGRRACRRWRARRERRKFPSGGVSQSRATRTPPEGQAVGRRGIKEYRAPEALILIAADRDQKPLVCPSCGAASVERIPERIAMDDAQGGKVTLHCTACSRTAA